MRRKTEYQGSKRAMTTWIRKLLIATFLLTGFVTAPAWSQKQNARPARVGGINCVEGQAAIDTGTLTSDSVGSVALEKDQTLTTQVSKVEILLTLSKCGISFPWCSFHSLSRLFVFSCRCKCKATTSAFHTDDWNETSHPTRQFCAFGGFRNCVDVFIGPGRLFCNAPIGSRSDQHAVLTQFIH